MDITLHFIEKGEGTPFFLLHGNDDSCAYFAAQIEAFSRRYHVYALDTRGHGQSPRGRAPFTLSQFADDLAAFLDEHGIDRAHILGFSDGGNIALTFALRYPDRVEKLILNGANLYPRGVKFSVQIPIELGYVCARLCGLGSAKAKAKADMLGLMVKEPHIRPDRLASLAVPTLVIAGTHDMIRDSHTRLIARSIPGARLELLPGTHFIARDDPAAFNARVLDFLNP